MRAKLRDYMGITAEPKMTNLVTWDRAMALNQSPEALHPFPGLHLSAKPMKVSGFLEFSARR